MAAVVAVAVAEVVVDGGFRPTAVRDSEAGADKRINPSELGALHHGESRRALVGLLKIVNQKPISKEASI